MTALIVKVPGKTILVGEHAVVYGFPAIAIPVLQLITTVKVFPKIGKLPDDIVFHAPDINLRATFSQLDSKHPFSIAIRAVKTFFKLPTYPACDIHINSSIPISAGLGSSAAVAVGLIRALSNFIGANPNPETIAKLAYQVEMEYHGTPSGIDNTVIAYQKPILFQKDQPLKIIIPINPITILIANSGVPGKTKDAVAGVRNRQTISPEIINPLLEKIGEIVNLSVTAIQNGEIEDLGMLMYENHYLLQKIGVSHEKLDLLVNTAKQNGALGAKLCGGGLGGNIIALVHPEQAAQIAKKLKSMGATQTYLAHLEGNF
ncbi:MAG: mevalonate kinase [Chloroflexi bacterium HGW-Chloroflexi-10]|nr:MAG: mevalonate kinase [Chloroflexi bacterium HGW-Chloroflexi-10]